MFSTRKELQYLNLEPHQMNRQLDSTQKVLRSPALNVIKENTYVAIWNDAMAQVGVVGRDHNSEVLFMASRRFPFSWPPAVSETVGIFFGISVAPQQNYQAMVTNLTASKW